MCLGCLFHLSSSPSLNRAESPHQHVQSPLIMAHWLVQYATASIPRLPPLLHLTRNSRRHFTYRLLAEIIPLSAGSLAFLHVLWGNLLLEGTLNKKKFSPTRCYYLVSTHWNESLGLPLLFLSLHPKFIPVSRVCSFSNIVPGTCPLRNNTG